MILAPTPTIEDAEQYLLSVQNEDGGWPYSQGLPSQPEPVPLRLRSAAILNSEKPSLPGQD